MLTTELIEKVNHEVNQNTIYKSDISKYGTNEWWTEAVGEGDCEDYALAKFRLLADYPKQIRLATCWVETGEYHAVLLVDVEGQTWVLDNRFPYPMRFQDLAYKWDKLQVAGTPNWQKAKESA